MGRCSQEQRGKSRAVVRFTYGRAPVLTKIAPGDGLGNLAAGYGGEQRDHAGHRAVANARRGPLRSPGPLRLPPAAVARYGARRVPARCTGRTLPELLWLLP